MLKRLLVAYYNRVWNKSELRLLPLIFADRCRIHFINSYGGASIVWSPIDIKHDVENWRHAFPNIRININNVVCDKQFVTVHFTVQGSHTGTWKGIEPTGKTIHIEMLNMFKVEGGKICEQWRALDLDEVIKQLTTHERISATTQSNYMTA